MTDSSVTRRQLLQASGAGIVGFAAVGHPTTAQTPSRKQWTFETDGEVGAAPTVVDGTVFVGCWDNNLYAVDAETGTQQWVFETGDWIRS